MRWPIQPHSGAVLRRRLGTLTGILLWIDIAIVRAPTIEINPVAQSGPLVEVDHVQPIPDLPKTQAASQSDAFHPAPAKTDCRVEVLTFANVDVVATDQPIVETEPPLSPSQFNPDPGAGAGQPVEPEGPPELFPPILPQLPEYGEEALPRSLELPRKGVR